MGNRENKPNFFGRFLGSAEKIWKRYGPEDGGQRSAELSVGVGFGREWTRDDLRNSIGEEFTTVFADNDPVVVESGLKGGQTYRGKVISANLETGTVTVEIFQKGTDKFNPPKTVNNVDPNQLAFLNYEFLNKIE